MSELKINDLVEKISKNEMPKGEDEVLVWRRTTYGSFGQHANIYTFVISLEELKQKAVYEVLKTRYVKNDSRKNLYRYTFVKVSDLLTLNNCILKLVNDSASSSRRTIEVSYYLIQNQKITPLKAEKGLRDQNGFFDLVELGNKKIIFRKDKIEVVKN